MSASVRRRHLVGVWNPTYEADAMDAHVSLLLRAARELRDGTRDESDVYVWWGKVRSSNRQAPLPHLADILALDDDLASGEDEPPELHLYLTDYRSLYVAHLAGVTAEDMSGEEGYVPADYREKGLNCDCWFQLWDIRRLVLDDTPAVVHELSKLRNLRYHDRPVSLYGGMEQPRSGGARLHRERRAVVPAASIRCGVRPLDRAAGSRQSGGGAGQSAAAARAGRRAIVGPLCKC